MPFKIIQKHEDCIGCGACVAIAPVDWKMDGDKATLIGSKKEGGLLVKIVNEVGSNKDAESACPVRCIKVEKV
ncbi:MAG: ferredoxin [archaeon]